MRSLLFGMDGCQFVQHQFPGKASITHRRGGVEKQQERQQGVFLQRAASTYTIPDLYLPIRGIFVPTPSIRKI